MKKINKIAFLSLIACVMLCIATACGLKPLNAPLKLKINEANVLSWVKVEDAKSYTVKVAPSSTDDSSADEQAIQEFTTRKASYSLSKLEEGDYKISVKAVSDGKTSGDSEWSEVIEWHRPYDSGCSYTLINNDTEYQLTNGKAASGDIRIEDVYNGKPVTAIADAAFKGNGRLTSVTLLGNNIKSIGDNAFYNCSKLEKIVIPESVAYIGSSAFQSCRSLQSVNIPSSVNAILKNTFAYCRSLTSLTLPEALTVIEDTAFSDCSAFTEVVIPDGVKSIGMSAYAGCKLLEKVTVGKGVESIGSYAFYKDEVLKTVDFTGVKNLSDIGEGAFSECSALTEIDLPEGLLSIGKGCFYNDVNMTEVSIPSSVSHVGVTAFTETQFYKEGVERGENLIYADNWLIYCADETRKNIERINPEVLKDGIVGIADEVFYNARKILTINLPSSMRHIGNYAFYCSPLTDTSTETSRSSLNTLKIADRSVETIGEYAFAGCDKLYIVNFGAGDKNGAGLKDIGNYAFYDCARLDNTIIGGEIDPTFIPESVTRIGTYAFRGTKLWRNAANDTSGDGVVYAGNWVVGFTKSVSRINLNLDNDYVSGIGDYAFYKCSSLQNISGIERVNYIGRGAFYGCSGLAAITLNRNLKEIGDYTFYKCSNLVRVSLPSTLTSIGRSSFYKCVTLNSIDFELTGVTEIKPYAFYGCSALRDIVFSEDLESIGDYAFYSNTAIAELNIPDKVEYIGVESFGKTSSLKSLDLGEGVKVIDDYAFYGCVGLHEINIPDSVERIGEYAFYNCKNVRFIDFGSGVRTLGDYSFYGISKLRDLFIPENVKEIGKYAFKGGKKLTSVVIGGSVDKIGEHAFFGAQNVTFYTDVESIKGEWNKRWNSSYRFVVWGCELTDGYVNSVVITESNITNSFAVGEIAAPRRDGYTFVGWSLSADSEEIAYEASKILEVPVGTKLYSVWREGVEEEPEEEDEEEPTPGGTLII